jgi:hypothetical protein
MAEPETWKTRIVRGLAVALLTLLASGLALKTRLSPLLIGLSLGLVCAFGAAFLEAAIRQRLVADSRINRAITLILLPPLGSLLAWIASADLAIGFTFSALVTWAFVYSLRALWERQRSTGVP